MPTIRQAVGRSEASRVRTALAREPREHRTRLMPIEVKGKKPDKDGRIWFEGMANVGTVDRTRDVILPSAWSRALKVYLKYSRALFWQHYWDVLIGEITEGEVVQPKDSGPGSGGGLWVRGYVAPNINPDTGEPLRSMFGDVIDLARMQLLQGTLKSLSVGIYIFDTEKGTARHPVTGKDVDVRIVKSLELLENSLVSVPSSREALVEVKAWHQAFGGGEMPAPDEKETESGDGAKPADDGDPSYQLVTLEDAGLNEQRIEIVQPSEIWR